MKKRIFLIVTLISLFTLAGCGEWREMHALESTIPAGLTNENDDSWAISAHFYLDGKGYFYNGKLAYELPEGYEYVGNVINVGNTFSGKNLEGNVDGKIYINESVSDTAYFSWAEWDEETDGPVPFLKLEVGENQ